MILELNDQDAELLLYELKERIAHQLAVGNNPIGLNHIVNAMESGMGIEAPVAEVVDPAVEAIAEEEPADEEEDNV